MARIFDNIKVKYKNMKLTRKMLMVYFIFVGVFFAVAITAFQISTDTFQEKLYESSLEELDYYVQSVRSGIRDLGDKTYEMAMNAEVQEIFSDLKRMEPNTLEYTQIMTNLRRRVINENSFQSVVRTVRYADSYGNIVEAGNALWEIPEEVFKEFSERIDNSNGEAIFYGPTKDCRYLLCGRKILKWEDMSLDNLGNVILACDVEQIIVKNKKQLEADHASLFVYSKKSMIYQDIMEDQPKLPDIQDGQGYKILTYRGEQYFMCYLRSTETGWMYVNFFPYSDIYGQITRVHSAAIIIFLTVFVVLILLMRKIVAAITKPLETLTQSMRIVETGDFESAKLMPMDADREDEVGLLTQEFQLMLNQIDVLIRENAEKQLLLQDTKYKMLQAQINPHFLYNTLNAIHWMIRSRKNEAAGRMIVELGTLLRASFDKDPYTTVAEEVNMLKSYLEIQQFRYEDRAEFSVRMKGEPGQYVIPRMILQPLVENAIFYGADVMTDICYIDITVSEEADKVLFEVKDNGPGIKAEELEKVRNFTVKPKGHGIGIKNIYERLNITFESFQFTVDSCEGQGTRVRIRVPKQIKEERNDVQTFNRR